ncbi:cytochrome P450 [Symbioplanes lichenis]|uniref:cytochrome P450 n=1 Tax=Symbioplanes lichenis TaxID=1629072 RepID=UPI0027398E13|nr:cytochrome P450 [Actinoplanes lichenis]
MQQTEGEEHARLRRLVSPAFTARRAAAFRPRIERIVDRLLDGLDDGTGRVDFLTRFAQPLPMDVITELVGIPADRREDWRAYGAALAAVNRDPRVFPEPERLDFGRPIGGHLGYAYGPHFCLGAALARVQVEVAVVALLKRFPGLELIAAERMPDPGAWRLSTLEVAL